MVTCKDSAPQNSQDLKMFLRTPFISKQYTQYISRLTL